MIKQITRTFILESMRNYGVGFGNILPAFIFLILSFIIKSVVNEETFQYMVKGQFLPVSILLLLFSFAFSSVTIYLADMKANRTFDWLKRTKITASTYYLGIGIGVFALANMALVVLLACYKLVIDIAWDHFFLILFICNFVLLALYPLSFILAGLFKNGKMAQSMLVPVMILLMFSITMTTMFLTLAGKDPQQYFIFLVWNPMLYLNDSLQYYLGLTTNTWLPLYQYLLILAGWSLVLALIARKVYHR
ncbi:ABC transporter permease [Metasolibacillus sp.]|uniref:ABC transporter permease n=1 Tax=Metasolibacillus sp. TaxID=2703680 RepID=UPI0025D1A644|nr:ABC transporter permease [Metasolibacillus sp.]MCT6923213.1 ABC transporter permease [Metasolibacillus sp.]MCT6939482.1 ABC transporter permease [Metasolibacillus sp.]